MMMDQGCNMKDLLLNFRVRRSYPDEAKHVNARENEIMDMWKALQVGNSFLNMLRVRALADFWIIELKDN